MKAILFIFVFLSFAKSYGEMAGPQSNQCIDIFPVDQRTLLQAAILRGVQIFDQRQNALLLYQNVYFHGTSIQNIQRATGDYFLGRSVVEYKLLSEFFSIYNNQHVVHAFQKETSPLSRSQITDMHFYAKFAAARFYLLQELNSPELYNPWFTDSLYDLLDIRDSDDLAAYVLGLIDEEQPALADTLSTQIDFQQVFLHMQDREGILVVIDQSIAETYPVERDSEDETARAIFTPQGIPWEFIVAIVPQTQAERDELADLLR